jgi:hypothetical protein
LEEGETNGQQDDLDLQDPVEDDSHDQVDSQPLEHNAPLYREGGGTQSIREGLPSPGRHLVKISKAQAYLHNFPEYTGPRARLDMKVLEGPDTGKILVDNISLPHQQESKGMQYRRVHIAWRLGLISWGVKENVQINWKDLEGVVCWVDVAYKNFGGRTVITKDNYELQ